jgi:hypothetical protein
LYDTFSEQNFREISEVVLHGVVLLASGKEKEQKAKMGN